MTPLKLCKGPVCVDRNPEGTWKLIDDFHSDRTRKDGKQTRCKECLSKRRKTYYRDNQAREKQYAADYRQLHPEYAQMWRTLHPDYSSEYYNKNKEELKRGMEVWRKEHPGYMTNWRKDNNQHVKAYGDKYYAANKTYWQERHLVNYAQNAERLRAYTRLWKKNNRAQATLQEQNRKARLLGSGGTHTLDEWKELIAYYDSSCICCGRNDVPITKDHVIPITLGGSNDISNIQPLCLSCNVRKFTKSTDYRYYYTPCY